MRLHVPPLALVLALLAACAPREGFAPTPPPTATPALAALPSPSATPTPRASATPAPMTTAPAPTATRRGADPTPEPKAYSVNLAKVADFVPQYTFDWCVGASIMMTRSILTDSRNESRASSGACGSWPAT